MTNESIIADFKRVVPAVDFWSLRLVFEQSESLLVRQGVLQPPSMVSSRGAHITLVDADGFAYGATSQLSQQGFRHCIDQAMRWVSSAGRHGLVAAADLYRPLQSGRYQSTVQQPWESVSLNDKICLLQDINKQLKIHDHIVDYMALLSHSEVTTLLLSSDGIQIEQQFHYIYPGFRAVANKGAQTQCRSGGGWGTARQGGLEQLAGFDFPQAAQQVSQEALALLDAPECPSGEMSVLLMPSQMMLQIHESIGHPLELDRILGDERNYAGTSFVTQEMFGQYQYGSDLLSVTFDPGIEGELASYGFDDDGCTAEHHYLIRNGILQRPLGGAVSQARAQMAGVSNARASSWNRPTMDRMANLNLEPGDHSLTELCKEIEQGILMDSNCSWSIDDSRNKFQFGCELGRVIENGTIKGLVRNPNYRGISANFWRNLAAVGSRDLFELWGTPNCGKGEPNQIIQVGHASPPCVFHKVDVFGGE